MTPVSKTARSSRPEQEIFDDLAALCVSPGYAHAIAYFCFRDHVVAYGDEMKGEDYAKLFSPDRLIRTEISTLVGLMLRAPRDLALPDPQVLQEYVNRTEALLKELHEALNQPAMAELVLIGDRAIVVQAKSKKLTLAARKGNDLQLQADFKGAVQDACDQAIDCSEHLLARTAVFSDAGGNEIAVPELKHVHPVCVVSDHYPALAFQAQQFLSVTPADRIKTPLVCDVFFIDVVTEFLETPLRFLSYLDLRARAGDNVSLSHEITALGFHLKQNLWLGEYDFIALQDDLSIDVDIAMAARRDGVAGEKVPPGILTQLRSTTVGRLIAEIEKRSEAGAISTGLELLKLSGETAQNLSRAIDRIVADATKDGKQHDISVGSSKAASGITIHCNGAPDALAAPKLRRHCELRKYSVRAATWCGLAVQPGSGDLRFGLMLDYPWQQDAAVDAAVAKMPKGEPIAELKRFAKPGAAKRRRIGRNDPCPCGSGLKYKKCHLQSGQYGR